MRPASSNPLTLDEHRHLGVELRKTRVRIHELCRLVVDVYGPNTQAAFSFVKAAEAIDRLCTDMETQAAHDWPGQYLGGIYQ